MAKESLIVILGEDTPSTVINEVKHFITGPVLTFDWNDEDNEDMPATAKYLAERYNVYNCAIMIGDL